LEVFVQTFDILDPDLDIHQSYFLEASAGTGKTFAIEHLVVRLLLEGEGMALPEILAVTFTREAAFEMKSRIRANLEKLQEQGNRRAREALLLFDEIQVFTIHGFCHRILSEFALEAGVCFELTSADTADHLKEMEKTVEDFFRTADQKFAAEVSALLKRARLSIDRLIQQIVAAIEKERPPSAAILPDLPSISLNSLHRDFHTLAPRYKRFDPEKWEGQLQKFHSYTETKNPACLLEEKQWFFERMGEDNAKVKAKPLTECELSSPEFFHALQNKLLPVLTSLRCPKEAKRRIAHECRRRWEVKAAREDHLTFDDLLKKVSQAIKNPRFREKVSKKYKAVIVDEFQDTDPLQWSIFETLFLNSHLLYLVGDPKQSIYGFRNADIYTYMRALKALGEEKKAILKTNFRSSPQLIAALNDLFTKKPDWIALPSLPGPCNTIR
jgi:exodeoxyribonuclease V beta subunit